MSKLFLQGLAAVLPLVLTLYVLWWAGTTAEQLLGPVIRSILPGDAYLPGMGVVLGLGLILAIGLILRAWWVRSMWKALERLLNRIPLVKTIYGSVKDLMTFFSDNDRKEQLNQVVLVTTGTPPVQLIGLITNENASQVTGRQNESHLVAVYLPMSYQIGGFMILVPRDSLEPIDMGVEDALRTIVTAGLSRGGEDDDADESER